jgi:pimeloyl-ACP methyl ester carboxylesterase
VRKGHLFPYGSWASRVALLHFVRDIPQRSTDPSYALLERIQDGLSRFRKHPMLICWGEKDFCFDDRALQGWISRFPEAVVHRFADASHYVVEDAREAIKPLLREFLQS